MNVSPVYHGAPAESRTPVEDRTYAALEELGIPFDRVDHDPAEDMADCAVISQALGARAAHLNQPLIQFAAAWHLTRRKHP